MESHRNPPSTPNSSFKTDSIAITGTTSRSNLAVPPKAQRSASVYPAAGFVAQAGALGIATCEINLEPSDNAELFDERRYGKASEVAPAPVEEALAGRPDERTIPRGAKLRPQL
ncbi:MAG: hypothetical protein WAV18_17715 [Roseiarcus sp.]